MVNQNFSMKGTSKPIEASEQEKAMKACSEIANILIEEYEKKDTGGKDINLNHLRGQVAKKHKLRNLPPLTAIIAAVPEHYKKYVVPKLIAKPISKLLFPSLANGNTEE